MSWDASIGGQSWNYTHNTNGMIAAALEAMTGATTPQAGGPLGRVIGPAWWDRLNGMNPEQGREYLGLIVAGLEADPERFRAMNPPNGWGDYDGLLRVMREMHEASKAVEWWAAG